jgi:hypothetical protein
LILKKFNYLLKPSELPNLHEKCKKEFARRYWFEELLKTKERELSRLISNENAKRSKFFSENGGILPTNPLTSMLLNYQIELDIKRNEKVPKVSDVETEETLHLVELLKKDMKEKDKTETLLKELRFLKEELKAKDSLLLKVEDRKAEEIERYSLVNNL